MDTDIVSSLTSHKPGYISESLKEKESLISLTGRRKRENI